MLLKSVTGMETKMDGADELTLIQHPDSTEEIPVLDIAPYIAGEPGARERIGAKLREIAETIGFFYLVGHGMQQSVIDGVFAQSKRFNQLPVETRRRMPRRTRGGYDAVEDKIAEAHPDDPPISLRSSYHVYREREPGHPLLDANHPYRLPNDWPDFLPGFREPVLEYLNGVEQVGLSMMPLWAAALDLPADYFAPSFREPYLAMSLIHYPSQEPQENPLFGIKPHTDNTVMTILALGDVPGLAVRMPSGHWKVAEPMTGAFMVNTGNSLTRWTNGRFLSTKHHVINMTGQERYSIPLFFGADLDAKIECLPTCQSAEKPAQFPPITYQELQDWYFFNNGYLQKSVGPGSKSDGTWGEAPTKRQNSAA